MRMNGVRYDFCPPNISSSPVLRGLNSLEMVFGKAAFDVYRTSHIIPMMVADNTIRHPINMG